MNPRDLKARLAREIITRLRGAEAAAAAEEHFDSVFRRHEAAADLQELALEPADVEDGGRCSCPAVLERWFGQTRSEWRRRIQQGGVSLDGEPVAEPRRPRRRLCRQAPQGRQVGQGAGRDQAASERPARPTASRRRRRPRALASRRIAQREVDTPLSAGILP